MTQQMVSRTQRRMEKKQTLFMVSMVLIVSLISFSLGVMVGRSGEQTLVAEERLSAQQPVTAQDQPAEPTQGTNSEQTETEEVQPARLTFYDTLADGQQNALGSGINLAPEPALSGPIPESMSPPAVTVAPEKKTQEVKPTAERAVSAPPVVTSAPPKPVVVTTGSYVIQVAAVKDLEGAEGLRERMKKQGYEAFVEKVDLAAKGTWYRIYAGPFASRRDADAAVQSLKADRISAAPLVRQR